MPLRGHSLVPELHVEHKRPVYETRPGNKDGITTLEEKSLGAVNKSVSVR